MIEGDTYHIDNITVARCLVKLTSRETVCQILNASNQTITLKKGCRIATLLPIDDADPENKRLLNLEVDGKKTEMINSVEIKTNDEKPHEEKLKALQNLGINFTKTQLEKKEFEQLIALIYKYKELFSTSITDLPVSTLPPMKITLTDQKLFRKTQYRLSPAMQDEVNKQCEELLAAKIIRPSTSQYNSPSKCCEKV